MTITLIHGDCLAVMREMQTGSIDAVITDPPYGCGKSDWDDTFPVAWYAEARRISRMVAIITGSSGLKDSIALVGNDFVDVISGRNLNGMTRAPLGFGNWLACVVALGHPRQGWNAFEFAVRGDMPNHPSPKPIEFMRRIIQRLTEPGHIVLDCFMGSGTTVIACLPDRDCIGIEIDKNYFEIASKRIRAAEAQLHLPLAIP